MKHGRAGPIGREDQDFGVKAGFLVHDVSRLRRAFFDEAMRPYGLTRSQWWVLGQLSRHYGKAMSQGDLAKHLDVGKAALGDLIDKLELAGYVQRDTAPGDRRMKLLSVTPKGREMTSILRRIGHDVNLEIFSGLTDGQVEDLERMLSLLKANLRKLVSGPEAARFLEPDAASTMPSAPGPVPETQPIAVSRRMAVKSRRTAI